MGKERTEQEQNNQKVLRRAGFLVLLVAIIGTGGFFCIREMFRVQPAFSSVVYELGDSISRDPADYLQGPEKSVEQSEIDLSQVDRYKAGIYQATALCDGNEYQYEIVIQDTVAPVITLREERVSLAVDREYSAEELVQSVEDADPQTILYFQDSGTKQTTMSYHISGSFECTLTAEDSSGNTVSVQVPVIVDVAPTISGVRDIYMALGSQVDYLDQVVAQDETDGDLTEKITVDDSEVQLNREGTYRLAYRVENNLGIDTVSYAVVTVASEKNLQELIGSRQVSRFTDRVIGAINPYDAGASDHESIDDTLEYIKPALVQLYFSDEYGYSAGSGFLMEITEDTVYICTNRHVAEVFDEWDVYFYDGTAVRGKSLGCSSDYDVGVVTVAVSDMQEELLQQLMTVHIDMDYWDSLNDQRIDLCLERLNRQGGILRVSTGTLLKVKQYFAWFNQKDHTEVTIKLEHGDSGSAVLDGYGNLIGMAYAYSSSPRRYWCIPLDGILESYEEITGRSVFVY